MSFEFTGHLVLSKRESESISPAHPFLDPSVQAHLGPEQESWESAVL